MPPLSCTGGVKEAGSGGEASSCNHTPMHRRTQDVFLPPPLPSHARSVARPHSPTHPTHPHTHPRERDTKRELVGLGSTPNRAAATAVEFLPNASKLSLLLADAGGSISLHVFDKNVRQGVEGGTEKGGLCQRRGSTYTGARMREHQPAVQSWVPQSSLLAAVLYCTDAVHMDCRGGCCVGLLVLVEH